MKFPCSKFILAVAVLFTSPAFAAEGAVMNWNVDGQTRSALVFAPQSGGGATKHPVIFVFHGHGGNMQNASRADYQSLWPEAVVVYPQGLPTKTPKDPSGTRPGWEIETGQDNNRDLKFFDAMLSGLKGKYAVDDARVYTTGFSNGAGFSYLLWAKRASVLAAIAPCAGAIRGDAPTIARPAIIIGGENDRVLPFSEQQRSIEAVRKLDAGKADLVTRIHPGGHVVPPWAGRAIVDFFKTHTL